MKESIFNCIEIQKGYDVIAIHFGIMDGNLEGEQLQYRFSNEYYGDYNQHDYTQMREYDRSLFELNLYKKKGVEFDYDLP